MNWKKKLAEDIIMELLREFWEERNNDKEIVWIKNDETGELVIYTPGEYSNELIDFINHLWI